MDVGPQNVLGKRPSLVDPLVQELIGRIENIISQPDIEFEGRIGTLSFDNKRLNLPITTECMLDTSAPTHTGRPFRYEFVPDIGKDCFEKIKQRLELLLSGKLSENPPNPLFKINSVKYSHTVDEIYKKPIACRISYDKASYGMADQTPLEIIVKESLEKLDVFAGHYADIDEEVTAEEEGAVRHPFDYRFSVNREKKLDPEVIGSLNRQDCQMVREKLRTSFDMKAWTVDMTKVTVLHGGSGDKYEFEVELKRELLAEQLERRAQGKPHGAYQILTDLLFFIRDIAYVFGPGFSALTSGAAKTFPGGFKYPELISCEPSDDRKRKYKDVLGTDVMPLIGDYVFRILDEIRPISH